MMPLQPPAGPRGLRCGWRMGVEMGWGCGGWKGGACRTCFILLYQTLPHLRTHRCRHTEAHRRLSYCPDQTDHRLSAASKSAHIHTHTNTRLHENSHQMKGTARIITNPRRCPPSTPKHGPLTSSPTALLANCQSHHSP